MIIPELEKIKSECRVRIGWTAEEDDTLFRYYKKVPLKELIKYLPGRTQVAIRVRVWDMKQKGKWPVEP